MFGNKSAEYPEGFLDRNTLKSFYAMTGTDGNLVYTPGNERIPDNWYTRALNDPYDVPVVDQDLIMIFQQHPELLAFGGNTGTVNSFAGLNVANLTVRHLQISLSLTSRCERWADSNIRVVCTTPRRCFKETI